MASVYPFEATDLERLLKEKQRTRRREGPRQPLLCAACRQPVTDAAQRTQRDGSHEHRFTNPHGITFRVGCFRQAPGAAALDPATGQWSWFSGYRWRLTICRSCGVHLGWDYQGEGDYFFGLILDRLVPGRE
ncbi:MAG: cereblon family protein [Candidatus Competibacteraceae bacterium]|nr:cereblon family protein [Candidatus Competibacteraceae bacterium]